MPQQAGQSVVLDDFISKQQRVENRLAFFLVLGVRALLLCVETERTKTSAIK